MPRSVAPGFTMRANAPPTRFSLAMVLLALGCENVTTRSAEQGASGQVVAADVATTEGVTTTSGPVVGPTPTQSPDDVLVPAAPSRDPVAPSRSSFGLEIDSETLFERQCRVWIDAPESDLEVTDLEVRAFTADSEDVGVLLARTEPPSCSATASTEIPSAVAAADATAPSSSPDRTASVSDAGVPPDAGTGGDSGPDRGLEIDSGPEGVRGPLRDGGLNSRFEEVDLAVEGWDLTHVSDGLWLEFCVNACYTLTRIPHGRVSVTVWYRVKRTAGAR
jgi:hypothetical protein